MDITRSRTCWASCAIVSLVVCSVFIYSTFKKTSETYDEETSAVTGTESAVKRTNPLVTKADSTLEIEKPVATTSDISDYNPLEGFERTSEWSEFRTHGALSASAADFQKGDECRRVVLFLGRGTILGHILTACDSLEPSMGLLMVDDILYYYGRAMEAQGPTDNTFTVAKKIIGERKCIVTSYTVNGESSRVEDKSEPKAFEDKNCKILINFKMPSMLLLSMNGKTGMYTARKSTDWGTVNPWEPLGAVTRLYWYGARCFRLLVITSYGRIVQVVKVSCGPVQNLVVTDNALNYGDALLVRRNTDTETFLIIYNPKRSGNCVNKIVTLSSKEGRTIASTTSKGNMNNADPDCQDLINLRISKSTVNKDRVSQLVRKLQLDSFDVEPYGVSLKDYTQYSRWSYFNLQMDLGLAVVYYKGKEGLSLRKLLLVVARGVPIAATLVGTDPIHRLVMRDDILFYDKEIMLRKTKDKDKFIAVIKVDEYNCFKKSYTLRDENGIIVKQELPSGGEVTKSMDEDCRDLIEGNKLKNPAVEKFGGETDEFGVPTEFPAGTEVSGKSSAQKAELKGRENGS